MKTNRRFRSDSIVLQSKKTSEDVEFMDTFFFASTLIATIWSADEDETPFYDTRDCGKRMACWYFPDGCDVSGPESCHAIVRWKLRKNKLKVQLQITKELENSADYGRYMALGFSEDRYMASWITRQLDNDTVVECVFDKDGKTTAFVSYNDHTSNVQLKDASKKLVKLKSSVVSDGRMQCEIQIDFGRHSKLQEGERETLISHVKNAEFILMFAQGLAESETLEKQMHAYYPWSTDDPVTFCDSCDSKFQISNQTSPHQPQRIRRNVSK
ncbi:hypothetical protein M3Y98_00931500 [Aphelenchoides besseyi]|nr:hypothetical protein M3Y98_00931500 [Aphelenchoides besseyi]